MFSAAQPVSPELSPAVWNHLSSIGWKHFVATHSDYSANVPNVSSGLPVASQQSLYFVPGAIDKEICSFEHSALQQLIQVRINNSENIVSEIRI